MGWMSWTRFYCDTDCKNHPFSCINEDLYKAQALAMREDGYLDVGYEYVHVGPGFESRKGKEKLGEKKKFASWARDLWHGFARRGDFFSVTSVGHFPTD
jgi:hypothetical protein